MRILGYGEDALTYWALSRHMTDAIGAPPLNDDSPAEKILFVYRPSFGRAGGQERAQFGEFDAVVGTPKAVYLIESKWTGETIINAQIMLSRRQVLRHQIFRWIRQHWLEQGTATWGQFYHQNAAAFANAFGGKPLAPPKSRLASNLDFLLQQLAGFPAQAVDVLLYFHLAGGPIPNGVLIPDPCPQFLLVSFVYQPLNIGGIIDMKRPM